MAQRCGLSKGYFRPSDDACTFSYHIPSQAMAVVEVGAFERLIMHVWCGMCGISTKGERDMDIILASF